MNVSFQTNNSGGAPFTAILDTSNETVHPQRVYNVPVHKNPADSGYFADICGFRTKAAEVDGLREPILECANGLINMARLPRHVFVARRAKRVYPIYTVDSEVMVTTPGGPVFKHVELAKVREYLTDYLHDAEILGEKGVSDKLHVRGTSLSTLQLRRPIFYLKKRIVGQPEFWSPVFETENQDGIYTYAASDRREVKTEFNGKAVLMLTRIVAEALQAENRLEHLYNLRPDRLHPHIWENLKPNLTPVGTTQIRSKRIETFTSDYPHIGVEYREDEQRYGLFLGETPFELEARIEADLKRRGL